MKSVSNLPAGRSARITGNVRRMAIRQRQGLPSPDFRRVRASPGPRCAQNVGKLVELVLPEGAVFSAKPSQPTIPPPR